MKREQFLPFENGTGVHTRRDRSARRKGRHRGRVDGIVIAVETGMDPTRRHALADEYMEAELQLQLAQQGDDRTARDEARLRLSRLEAIVTAQLLHDARDDGQQADVETTEQDAR